MPRPTLIPSAALACLLVAGTIAAPTPLLAKEKQAGPKYSEAFIKIAAPIQKAMNDATAGLSGALTPDKLAPIKAKLDASLGGNAAAAVSSAEASATTPDDKALLGSMIHNYGVIAQDEPMMLKGLKVSIASGALAPDQLGKANFDAGATSYDLKDYAGATTYLKAAKDAGYHDPGNQLDLVLADAYTRSGNAGAAADVTSQAIAAARAAGTKPSESALRSALQASYDAKNLPNSVDLSTELVRDYPAPGSWSSAISVVRALGDYAGQENLDLMRLMSRTDAMTQRADYLEYVENADPRRLPGETLKVLDAGVAAGKLQPSDNFVSEMRKIATTRLAADKASLPGLERDARAASANAATASGAGDAFLSYDQPAKAEDLYKAALGKPGVDKDRVLTRLGIAQADQGNYAAARQSFGQVSGPRTSIAKLWSAYATVKQGGGAAPAPAATTAQ